MNLTIQEIQEKVINWARERDLLKRENAQKQFLKFLEEVGETAKAFLKNDVPEIKDGFGDIAATLFILAEQTDVELVLDMSKIPLLHNYSFSNVVSNAYEEGTDRNIIISLAVYAKQEGYDLTECLNLAWSEIKDRKGKTLNGTFVKE